MDFGIFSNNFPVKEKNSHGDWMFPWDSKMATSFHILYKQDTSITVLSSAFNLELK